MIDEWGMDKNLLICNFLFLKISSATALHLILLIWNILQFSSTPRLHGDTVDQPLLPIWFCLVIFFVAGVEGGPLQMMPTSWVQQNGRLANGVKLLFTWMGWSSCGPRFRFTPGTCWAASAAWASSLSIFCCISSILADWSVTADMPIAECAVSRGSASLAKVMMASQ